MLVGGRGRHSKFSPNFKPAVSQPIVLQFLNIHYHNILDQTVSEKCVVSEKLKNFHLAQRVCSQAKPIWLLPNVVYGEISTGQKSAFTFLMG